MLRIITVIIIAVLIGLFIKTYGVDRIYIASASMEPTLKVKDEFWLNKLVYLLRSPQRMDFVAFKSPVKEIYEVKRIIGIPGDKVEIISKAVYVNDKQLEEPYIQHIRGDEILEDDDFGPYVVPSDSIFVLGDNRDESEDSRNWKDPDGNHIPFVPFKNLQGNLVK